MSFFSHVILESACEIADKVEASHIFVYADSIKDIKTLEEVAKNHSIIFASRNEETLEEVRPFVKHVLEVPQVNLTRMGQVKMAVMMGLSVGLVGSGDRIVCIAGIPRFGTLDSVIILDIGKEFEILTSSIASIGENIKHEVFEGVLSLAVELANEGREGKPIGTIFVLGDHDKVLQLSRQLIINPFRGYPEEERNILDPSLRDTIKEFSALDGAFVIREDGVVITAGRHLSTALEEEDLPRGLGSRHVAAAGITHVTEAIAIVISESTGVVRIFKNGQILMEIEKSSG
ncbi:MAG: DNA integrity scanning protein DisA nucleotide-binding domain protein [Candidatus Tectomicrobia bacterium]|nr:DNA integrity scanning protein DisA nucleotide-binding domain protein [Candidatus Tectomicrobia bacterium]